MEKKKTMKLFQIMMPSYYRLVLINKKEAGISRAPENCSVLSESIYLQSLSIHTQIGFKY